MMSRARKQLYQLTEADIEIALQRTIFKFSALKCFMSIKIDIFMWNDGLAGC
jgi:hypothetical protein